MSGQARILQVGAECIRVIRNGYYGLNPTRNASQDGPKQQKLLRSGLSRLSSGRPILQAPFFKVEVCYKYLVCTLKNVFEHRFSFESVNRLMSACFPATTWGKGQFCTKSRSRELGDLSSGRPIRRISSILGNSVNFQPCARGGE